MTRRVLAVIFVVTAGLLSILIYGMVTMAAVPPGQPIAPGISTGVYPMYGVKGSIGSTMTIVTADNAAQQEQDMEDGVLVWFSSESAAQSYISSENSLFNGNVPGSLTGLADIGNFFGRLTEPSTWIRVGEVAVGILVLYVGIKAIFPQTVRNVTAPVRGAVKTAAVVK